MAAWTCAFGSHVVGWMIGVRQQPGTGRITTRRKTAAVAAVAEATSAPNSSAAASALPEIGKKVAIITGASTGIGLVTAEGLARSGLYGTIILAGRDEAKHQRALEELRAALGPAGTAVEFKHMNLELDDLQSVRDFATEFLDLGLPLHTLILNAGVMAIPDRKLTANGFEYQFGVNHLAHFLLANLLLDSLVASSSWSDPGRLISLSSSAHQFPSALLRGDLTDLQSERYNAWSAYGQSKLANMLFAYELDRRCRQFGVPLAVNAVHPGVVNTDLARYLAGDSNGAMPISGPGGFASSLTDRLTSLALKTPKDGAATSVLLATKQEGTLSGRYWQDERPSASIDFDLAGGLPEPARALLPFGGPPRFTSYDPGTWEALWRDSAALVGLPTSGGSVALSGPGT